jgi:hypothetical protein
MTAAFGLYLRRANMNGFYNQIIGPFEENEEIMDLISEQNSDINSIIKLGIQSKTRHEVYINNVLFELGKTGILETDYGVNITSIRFNQKEDANTIIDFICE